MLCRRNPACSKTMVLRRSRSVFEHAEAPSEHYQAIQFTVILYARVAKTLAQTLPKSSRKRGRLDNIPTKSYPFGTIHFSNSLHSATSR